jgi:hypothetical protein
MNTRSKWITISLIALAGFTVVNAYMYYLSTRIVPFEERIALGDIGYSESFQISNFHSANYVLALSIDHPDYPAGMTMSSLMEVEEDIRNALDIDLQVNLRDGSGATQIYHQGDLSDWRLTNSPFGESSNGGFWKYRFDAQILENYTLDIVVTRTSESADEYSPTLLFHGIDDGYFWLASYIYNFFWFVLMAITAVIGFVIGRVRNRG